MDMISCHIPDLLSIGDYVLFGSKVGIVCQDEQWLGGDERKRRAVQICRGANVLDNCVLSPGVTVGQRAVLGAWHSSVCQFWVASRSLHLAASFPSRVFEGTNTLGAPGQYFTPDTINTGNKAMRVCIDQTLLSSSQRAHRRFVVCRTLYPSLLNYP
eukprot:6410496-Amphidinium_carterae.1